MKLQTTLHFHTHCTENDIYHFWEPAVLLFFCMWRVFIFFAKGTKFGNAAVSADWYGKFFFFLISSAKSKTENLKKINGDMMFNNFVVHAPTYF